jgi:hypothetical protein
MSEPLPSAPRLPEIPEGSAHCGACDGVQSQTPRQVRNRHGLSQVRYRIGDWSQFRASLHAGLSDTAFAPLQALLTRDDDDFAIALIDAFACSAEVLDFHTERIAQESWLATATERVSLQELGRLTGYRLRPGVAAETLLAFSVEAPPVPAAAMPPDPGVFIGGVPAGVDLPAGFKVQSLPGQDEKPQVFETLEALQARPHWNAMRAMADADLRPAAGAREAWLAGTATQLRPGDMLVFAGPQFAADPASNRWDARAVKTVEVDAAGGRTRVAWDEPLGSTQPRMAPADPAEVHVLRERAAIFGHNAPSWRAMSDAFKASYLGHDGPSDLTAADRGGWPGFDIWAPVGRTSPLRGAISLDREYAGVVPGSYVLLERPDYRELYRVDAAGQGSRAEFALQGKSTYLLLSGANLDTYADGVRDTTVHVRSEPLALARAPIAAPVEGTTVQVATDLGGLVPGRRVLVRGRRVADGVEIAHAATVTSAVPAAAPVDGGVLTIDPPLPAPLVRSTVVVFGNVALASHGETVAQVLGSGDAAQAHQRFDLKHAPLTHRSAATDSGVSPALTVRVGDIEWQHRPSLYGAGPGERVYTLVTDEQARTWVQFGDGRNGARLPSASNNLRMRYRKGLGVEGNVRAGSLSQAMARPLGFKGVENPLPASGGTAPEAADSARRSMPLGARTLGRAVSLLDYEDFARAFAGIAKSQARVLRLRQGPVVAVTIAGSADAPLHEGNPVHANLLAALRAGGDPHVQVRLLAHRARSFRLGLKVRCDDGHDPAQVLSAVEAALRAAFAFDARALGQPVHASEVVSVAHGVRGVRAIDLDFLFLAGMPVALRTGLHAEGTRVVAGQAAPADVLTLDPAPLVRLEAMP